MDATSRGRTYVVQLVGVCRLRVVVRKARFVERGLGHTEEYGALFVTTFGDHGAGYRNEPYCIVVLRRNID